MEIGKPFVAWPEFFIDHVVNNDYPKIPLISQFTNFRLFYNLKKNNFVPTTSHETTPFLPRHFHYYKYRTQNSKVVALIVKSLCCLAFALPLEKTRSKRTEKWKIMGGAKMARKRKQSSIASISRAQTFNNPFLFWNRFFSLQSTTKNKNKKSLIVMLHLIRLWFSIYVTLTRGMMWVTDWFRHA